MGWVQGRNKARAGSEARAGDGERQAQAGRYSTTVCIELLQGIRMGLQLPQPIRQDGLSGSLADSLGCQEMEQGLTLDRQVFSPLSFLTSFVLCIKRV